MKSKVHPTYKTTYRVGNWREYERALVQRGDVTLWLSAAATDAWRPSPSGRPGGQKRFSDVAIETALILRLVFGLPLRQTEGFVRSVLALMGADLDAPDHTTLSRRSQQLAVMLRRIPATDPIHLIVDSTGLWVSNSLSGRRWQLHQVPAVRCPPYVVEVRTGYRVSARHGERRVAVQGRVAPCRVVVGLEVGEFPLQIPRIPEEHLVQKFSPYRADQALYKGV